MATTRLPLSADPRNLRCGVGLSVPQAPPIPRGHNPSKPSISGIPTRWVCRDLL